MPSSNPTGSRVLATAAPTSQRGPHYLGTPGSQKPRPRLCHVVDRAPIFGPWAQPASTHAKLHAGTSNTRLRLEQVIGKCDQEPPSYLHLLRRSTFPHRKWPRAACDGGRTPSCHLLLATTPRSDSSSKAITPGRPEDHTAKLTKI